MTEITEIKPSVNPDAIRVLKDILVRAEAGEIRGVAVATEGIGKTGNVFVVSQPVLMLGELGILYREVMDAFVDLRCPVNDGSE